MSVTIRNLSVLAHANGFTLWHYAAQTETREELATPGYFTPAADLLAPGDILMLSAADGARLLCVLPASPLTLAPLG